MNAGSSERSASRAASCPGSKTVSGSFPAGSAVARGGVVSASSSTVMRLTHQSSRAEFIDASHEGQTHVPGTRGVPQTGHPKVRAPFHGRVRDPSSRLRPQVSRTHCVTSPPGASTTRRASTVKYSRRSPTPPPAARTESIRWSRRAPGAPFGVRSRRSSRTHFGPGESSSSSAPLCRASCARTTSRRAKSSKRTKEKSGCRRPKLGLHFGEGLRPGRCERDLDELPCRRVETFEHARPRVPEV